MTHLNCCLLSEWKACVECKIAHEHAIGSLLQLADAVIMSMELAYVCPFLRWHGIVSHHSEASWSRSK